MAERPAHRSLGDPMQTNGVASSPRTWGWTRDYGESERPPRSSPRTWGWTDERLVPARRRGLFPTHVGVDRIAMQQHRARKTLPHARGGGPASGSAEAMAENSSPRTWGWTLRARHRVSLTVLFPTHVGVDRPGWVARLSPSALPHARGGGPGNDSAIRRSAASSPRTWGWTDWRLAGRVPTDLFPTHVGVDRHEHGPGGA